MTVGRIPVTNQFAYENFLMTTKGESVKKHVWTKWILSLFLSLGIFGLGSLVSAVEQSDDCSKEILLAYFPTVFVNDTLSRFNVPKDQWEAIDKELSERDKGIIKIVESKAEKINPNPLKDPQQRQVAVKIFRETLLENFSAVMKAHGVKDDKQIQSMLDDIQQQKAKRFSQCMEKQTAPAISTEKPKQMTKQISAADYSDDDDFDDEK